MPAAADLAAALDAVRAVRRRFHTASDDELLADLDAIESIGRLVDGLRVGAAAEAERRSAKTSGEDSLAFRSGARDGVELVRRSARIGHREARRRVALGTALAPAIGLDGQPHPGRLPLVADALEQGRIGVAAARAVVTAWKAVRSRATAEEADAMVESLVDTAEREDVETLGDVAAVWALALDPDGAEPAEEEQRRRRALTLGRTAQDGTTRAVLVLTPEHLAVLRELLASRRRGVLLVRTEPGGEDDPDTDGPEWREAVALDGAAPRSRAQQDYDTLFAVLEAGVRAEQDGADGIAHEVVVTVAAEELEARRGRAWSPGVLAALPMPVVERRACTGGVRLLVTGPRGEPLHLSRTHRLFTPAQRKALLVAAGGRCRFPGCRTPAPYLEAHHVEWWARDGGRTRVDNGVMLCGFHHHLVHARRSPVEIRRWHADHWFVPSGWTGPPRPEHRAGSGPWTVPRPPRPPGASPWVA